MKENFLKLVDKNYPHGTEVELISRIEEMANVKLAEDGLGNYYHIIDGDDTTMFTSHLDTVGGNFNGRVDITTVEKVDENGDIIISTDSDTILGADDKAGVVLMIEMIKSGKPGIYYFFVGEERGGIGSSLLNGSFGEYDFLSNVNKCVSFDRRGNNSVITHQMGRRCCSEEFAEELIERLNDNGMDMYADAGGIYTDSAFLTSNIKNCTNISVGYRNEHSTSEWLNISHLERLTTACIAMDWNF